MLLLFEYLVTEYDVAHGDTYLNTAEPAVGDVKIRMHKYLKFLLHQSWTFHMHIQFLCPFHSS